MGRSARGVKGMKVSLLANDAIDDEELLDDSDNEDMNDNDGDNAEFVSRVVSLVGVQDVAADVLCVCANGYGKRTDVSEFSAKGRGGQGNIAIKTSARNGELLQAITVTDNDDVVLISDKGTMVRTPVAGIAKTGRNAQGVRLIRVMPDETLVGLACVEHEETDDTEETVPVE